MEKWSIEYFYWVAGVWYFWWGIGRFIGEVLYPDKPDITLWEGLGKEEKENEKSNH